MNQLEIELLIKLIMSKAPLIVNEIKHLLISLSQDELNDIQLVVIENAIQGALITGMKTTIEKVLSK